MNWKMTAAVADGTLRGATAGAAKTYGTETHIDVQRTLSQVLGAGGRLRPGSPGAVLPARSSSSRARASSTPSAAGSTRCCAT